MHPYTTTQNEDKETEARRFCRLLRPPTWTRNGSILEEVDK